MTEQPSASWTKETEIRVRGRIVRPGTELSFKRERGRFRFVEQTTTPEGRVWLRVVGGPKGYSTTRFFTPEQIRTVHVKKTTITVQEARDRQRAKRAAKREGPA